MGNCCFTTLCCNVQCCTLCFFCTTIWIGYMYTYILEEEMGTHSSILAWRIPWTEEPGGLKSMGSQSQTQLSNLVHTHIYISSLLSLPPTVHPTPLGHHRALSWAPCAIQQLPPSYLFYTQWYIYVNATLSICPTLPFSLYPQVHSSCPCLYSCPANRFICTIFLDSIYTWVNVQY